MISILLIASEGVTRIFDLLQDPELKVEKVTNCRDVNVGECCQNNVYDLVIIDTAEDGEARWHLLVSFNYFSEGKISLLVISDDMRIVKEKARYCGKQREMPAEEISCLIEKMNKEHPGQNMFETYLAYLTPDFPDHELKFFISTLLQ